MAEHESPTSVDYTICYLYLYFFQCLARDLFCDFIPFQIFLSILVTSALVLH